MRFDYQLPGRDAPLERWIAPLRLHRAEGRWHLIGFDHDRGAARVFLLSRISSQVRLGNEHYSPEMLSLVEPALDELRALQGRLRARVSVRVGSAAEARFEARALGDTAETEDVPVEGQSPSEARLLEIGTIDLHALASEIAGCGDEAEVRSPPELRDTVLEALRAVREQHAGGGADA